MLAILAFIIILGLLVFVHEAGHFIVAKRSGMGVEEFGFGFPPRMVGFQRIGRRWRIVGRSRTTPSYSPARFARTPSGSPSRGGGEPSEAEGEKKTATIYSVNWIPLGGFVRITGEDSDAPDAPDNFAAKPKWQRALVLVAGVAMNVALAVVLFTAVFTMGAPQVVDDLPPGARVRDVAATVSGVLAESPAAAAGIISGDTIIAIDGTPFDDADAIRTFVQEHLGQALVVTIEREIERGWIPERRTVTVTPGPIPGYDRGGMGVQLLTTGIVQYPIHRAFIEGVKTTVYVSVEIARALGHLVSGLVMERRVTVDVAGPVGIAVMTGQIASLGIIHLAQFTAVLSANLAFINVLPLPALDGGRLLFLAVEAIRRRALSRGVERIIHAVGFAALIGIILLVTYRDLTTYGGGWFSAIRGAVGM